MTQQAIAEVIGWSVDKVKRYSALRKVTENAWTVVVTDINRVTEEVTLVTFSENLLRPIIQLTPAQQLQLVKDLAAGNINKNRFKLLANKYAQQNKDKITLAEALPHISDEILEEGFSEIDTGNCMPSKSTTTTWNSKLRS